MAKSISSKTTVKKKRTKTPGKTDPQVAIRRTVASASMLVETMIKVIEEEVTSPKAEPETPPTEGEKPKKKRKGKMPTAKDISGPQGAIANLHKLMQVLDKLSTQLEHLETMKGKKKKAEAVEPLSKEDLALIEAWLKDKG